MSETPATYVTTGEPVDHPRHYNAHPSGVECIDIVEHMSFNLGTAVKHLWRADAKGDALLDLRKALWYIGRELERRQRQGPLHDTAALVRLRAIEALWLPALNRRTQVEQLMLDAANGKRAMPAAEELRAWAMRLAAAEPPARAGA